MLSAKTMSKFNFQRVIDNIDQVKRELPVLLANDAMKYFLASFNDQGWNGQVWEEVERRKPETNAYKYAKPVSKRTMPILQGTGRLRREVSLIAGNAVIKYDQYNFHVKLVLDDRMVPYGKFINIGTDDMPRRKFMGDSPTLRSILFNRIKSYMDKVWKTA